MSATLVSCDSCGNSMPRGCVVTRMAYGCEGSFCCECRQQDDHGLCDIDEPAEYVPLLEEDAVSATARAAHYMLEAGVATEEHWRSNRMRCAEAARGHAAHSRQLAAAWGPK